MIKQKERGKGEGKMKKRTLKKCMKCLACLLSLLSFFMMIYFAEGIGQHIEGAAWDAIGSLGLFCYTLFLAHLLWRGERR